MKKIIFLVSLLFCSNAFAQGFGTLFTDKASKIKTDTSNFDSNLSTLDTTVQKALETLDELISSGGGGGSVAVQNNDSTVLASTSTIDFSSRFIVTSGPSTEANIELRNTGVVASTYNAATLTVDQYGRLTAAASSSLTGLSDVNSATQGSGRILISDGANFNSVSMSGDISITGSGVTDIGTSGVVAGSYTNTDLTVAADGRITAASNGTGGSGGSCWEEDGGLDLQPVSGSCTDTLWEEDGNGDLQPQT